MSGLKRRTLLQTSIAAAGTLAAPQIKAQSKPEKLVYVGDNGPWHYAMVEEVAPAFEKATGIKIDFTLLPTDPWRTRLRTELGGGSTGIDVAQWGVGMAGWIAPSHGGSRAAAGADQVASCLTSTGTTISPAPRRRAPMTESCAAFRTASPPASSITSGRCWSRPASARHPARGTSSLKVAIAVNKPPDRYGFGTMGLQGAGLYSGYAPWLYSNGGTAARLQDR